ncbi:hypothetical protein [Neobacillus niacini]|uniref:hypothetical protein n=1 Tax=Neobacillus niacini TaxID=86668 RepID=UPI003983424C
MKPEVEEGEKIYIMAGCIYCGEVTEINEVGLWLTEDYVIEEFVAFADITEWAVE